jgi:hypothetical protein
MANIFGFIRKRHPEDTSGIVDREAVNDAYYNIFRPIYDSGAQLTFEDALMLVRIFNEKNACDIRLCDMLSSIVKQVDGRLEIYELPHIAAEVAKFSEMDYRLQLANGELDPSVRCVLQKLRDASGIIYEIASDVQTYETT